MGRDAVLVTCYSCGSCYPESDRWICGGSISALEGLPSSPLAGKVCCKDKARGIFICDLRMACTHNHASG